MVAMDYAIGTPPRVHADEPDTYGRPDTSMEPSTGPAKIASDGSMVAMEPCHRPPSPHPRGQPDTYGQAGHVDGAVHRPRQDRQRRLHGRHGHAISHVPRVGRGEPDARMDRTDASMKLSSAPLRITSDGAWTPRADPGRQRRVAARGGRSRWQGVRRPRVR